jgi:hypothetical protein
MPQFVGRRHTSNVVVFGSDTKYRTLQHRHCIHLIIRCIITSLYSVDLLRSCPLLIAICSIATDKGKVHGFIACYMRSLTIRTRHASPYSFRTVWVMEVDHRKGLWHGCMQLSFALFLSCCDAPSDRPPATFRGNFVAIESKTFQPRSFVIPTCTCALRLTSQVSDSNGTDAKM